ncbi:MAG: hypothetical protein BroJett003_12520 [Planctomycetota bacterium]|nr:MAG: hypothetical protein BroJett003_12520 [Planctomycetota bacterium]
MSLNILRFCPGFANEQERPGRHKDQPGRDFKPPLPGDAVRFPNYGQVTFVDAQLDGSFKDTLCVPE